MIERWRRVLADASPRPAPPALGTPPSDHLSRSGARQFGARSAIRDELHNDLNIAGAIGAFNQWLGLIDLPTAGDADLIREFDAILGVLMLDRPAAATTSIGLFAPGLTPDPAVIALLEQRRDARAARDFKQSDAIRDQLAAMGYAIKDAAGGKVEVRRA